MFSRFFPRRTTKSVAAVLPPGRRLYAIGDVHGRLDLLDTLLDRIDADSAARDDRPAGLIFLGDLVDRGPDSAGVVERVRALCDERPDTRCLKGNHEELLLLTIQGDERAARVFCRAGGDETALSYGIAADRWNRLEFSEVGPALADVVPDDHYRFLADLPDVVVEGSYAFVHAGLRPGVALADQTPADLRWIRQPFLDHAGPLDHVVIHGHTVTPDVAFRPHRIGIDTGAYASGRLTALGLEGDRRWILSTRD